MDFQIPELGEGVYEAEFVAWLVQPGQIVKRGHPLFEVLTDKATMEVPSPFAGAITSLKAESGQKIKVGQVVLTYNPAGQANEALSAPPKVDAVAESLSAKSRRAPLRANGNATKPQSDESARPPAAPSVRQMARKLGVDLSSIDGSGPHGRILIQDLATHVQGMPPAAARPGDSTPFPLGEPGTRIKLIGVRRKIADHMVESKHTIPHYSYVDECDVTELTRLRMTFKDSFAQAGAKLTYLPFVVKAVVAALKKVPLVNASLDEKSGEIHLHDYYHIGVATAAPAGLMVPIIHDADKKNLFQIAKEIDLLSAAARSGKIKAADLKGGTFTITSIGNIGGLIATPIINHPEVGILGIGKIVKRPIYDNRDQIKPAEMVYLSFSFDHRVLDGAIGAVFGNAVIDALQNPASLLVEDMVKGA